MIVFSLAVAPLIHVALVGDLNIGDLPKWLGSRYSVKSYPSAASAAESRSEIVVVNLVPASGAWARVRDRFVPQVESELNGLRAHSPASRIYLVLPVRSISEFSGEIYSTEVVPLLKQAAAETDIESILIHNPMSAAEDISDAVIDFGAQKTGWHVTSVDSEETDEGPAVNAIDGKLDTYWHTRYSPKNDPYPHQITVDMGSEVMIGGFRYVPRQDGGTNGRVKSFEFYVSLDGHSWGQPATAGILANGANPQAIHFKSATMARYFKFVALSEQSGGPWASAAEIDVLPAP